MAKAPPSAKRDRIKGFVPALVDYTQRRRLRRPVGAAGSVEARPQPRHRGGADRDLSARAARDAPDARHRQRRDQGGNHRGDHASCVLCRLAVRRCRRRSSPTRCSSKTRKARVRTRWRTRYDRISSDWAPWAASMAANLQKAGYRLVVHDLHRQAASHHLQAGATWAETPRALAAQCDVIFTSLPEPPDVEAVAIGADGLLAGMKPGAAFFDLSTNSPSVVKKLHAAFAEKGAHMLDAPVSGGPQGAASRKLAIWVGGEQRAFDRHKAGARRDRRQGGLYRTDRLRDGRQAGAQHVGLRDRLRARRDLCARREGRRRAARAVERGAPGRGRPALDLRRAGRSVPARQLRSAGICAEARAQGCVARQCARPRARRADAHVQSRARRDDRGDGARLGRARLARRHAAAAGARRRRDRGRSGADAEALAARDAGK